MGSATANSITVEGYRSSADGTARFNIFVLGEPIGSIPLGVDWATAYRYLRKRYTNPEGLMREALEE